MDSGAWLLDSSLPCWGRVLESGLETGSSWNGNNVKSVPPLQPIFFCLPWEVPLGSSCTILPNTSRLTATSVGKIRTFFVGSLVNFQNTGREEFLNHWPTEKKAGVTSSSYHPSFGWNNSTCPFKICLQGYGNLCSSQFCWACECVCVCDLSSMLNSGIPESSWGRRRAPGWRDCCALGSTWSNSSSERSPPSHLCQPRCTSRLPRGYRKSCSRGWGRISQILWRTTSLVVV